MAFNLFFEVKVLNVLILKYFAKFNKFQNILFESFDSSECFPPVTGRIQIDFVEKVRILEIHCHANSCDSRRLLWSFFSFIDGQKVEADGQTIPHLAC